MKFLFLGILYLAVDTTRAGGFYGSANPQMFWWCIFFCFLGAVFSLFLEANKRDIDSTNTPKKFSYRFLIEKNWKRILTSIMAMYIVMRFSPEITKKELSEFWSLVIGLGYDRAILAIKRLKKQI